MIMTPEEICRHYQQAKLEAVNAAWVWRPDSGLWFNEVSLGLRK